jgi:glycosyltransferase involved in cell wall biosynthesis
MARHDLSNRDASSHATSELDYIISSGKKKAEFAVPSVTAEQAMSAARLLETKSNRNVIRVLFVSRDTGLLNPAQQTLDGYVDISDLFDEVHVLILREGIAPRNPVLRVADNVWLYTATAKHWWLTPSAAMDMAQEQLEFASGFRPDLIVARDPFESAIVARKLGKRYGRPTQLHIIEDYSTGAFVKKSPHNFWRVFLPRFTIPNFASVRTLTTSIKNKVKKKFSIADIETLPRYQNYEALVESDIRIDLKNKYKPFVFFMVFVGTLDHKSSLHQVFVATQHILLNPRVGLIVFGDGPLRKEFEKQAKTLGISEQIIFILHIKNVVPYLKSANLLLVGDTDFDSEEVVLKGAAAGIPMVLATTEKRSDIFEHGKSAFLCDVTETAVFNEHIERLLDDVQLREKFVTNAQKMIRKKFYNNPSKYLTAYRETVEEAFFAGGDEEESGSK